MPIFACELCHHRLRISEEYLAKLLALVSGLPSLACHVAAKFLKVASRGSVQEQVSQASLCLFVPAVCFQPAHAQCAIPVCVPFVLNSFPWHFRGFSIQGLPQAPLRSVACSWYAYLYTVIAFSYGRFAHKVRRRGRLVLMLRRQLALHPVILICPSQGPSCQGDVKRIDSSCR